MGPLSLRGECKPTSFQLSLQDVVCPQTLTTDLHVLNTEVTGNDVVSMKGVIVIALGM